MMSMLTKIRDILLDYSITHPKGVSCKCIGGASSHLQVKLNEIFESGYQDLEKQKDGAYKERNKLVVALSKIFPSHLCRHDENDKEWENDWRWIVCIHIPTKELTVFGDSINQLSNLKDRWQIKEEQITWHIHDSEKEMFNHLLVAENHWDGHTTDEKYDRLSKLFIK